MKKVSGQPVVSLPSKFASRFKVTVWKDAEASTKRKLRFEGDEEVFEKRLKLREDNKAKEKKEIVMKSKKSGAEKGKKADDDTRGFVTQCRPNGLYNLVKSLNEKQKEDVKSIGFGGLLHLSITSCNTKILQWLVQNFNGKSRMLTIDSSRSFAVTPDDIHDVFLLPRNDGCDVLKAGKNEELGLLVDLKNKCDIDRRSKLSFLADVIEKNFPDGGDDFKRLFVLYSLSSFLTPSSNRLVKLSAVKSLIDVDSISKFDWCGFILKKLCSAAVKYNLKKCKNVSGCVILLQILYFHRLKWQGVAEPCTLPLLQHWSEAKMRNRSNEESASGCYGQGEMVIGTYPVSLNKVEKEYVEGSLDGVDESSRYIKFKLSSGDLNDSQIHNIARDDIHELYLLFKRDISVVSRHHMNRLLKLKRKVEDQQDGVSSDSPILSESQRFFSNENVKKYIDDVEKFTMMGDMTREMHSFDLLTYGEGHTAEAVPEKGDDVVTNKELTNADLSVVTKGSKNPVGESDGFWLINDEVGYVSDCMNGCYESGP